MCLIVMNFFFLSMRYDNDMTGFVRFTQSYLLGVCANIKPLLNVLFTMATSSRIPSGVLWAMTCNKTKHINTENGKQTIFPLRYSHKYTPLNRRSQLVWLPLHQCILWFSYWSRGGSSCPSMSVWAKESSIHYMHTHLQNCSISIMSNYKPQFINKQPFKAVTLIACLIAFLSPCPPCSSPADN